MSSAGLVSKEIIDRIYALPGVALVRVWKSSSNDGWYAALDINADSKVESELFMDYNKYRDNAIKNVSSVVAANAAGHDPVREQLNIFKGESMLTILDYWEDKAKKIASGEIKVPEDDVEWKPVIKHDKYPKSPKHEIPVKLLVDNRSATAQLILKQVDELYELAISKLLKDTKVKNAFMASKGHHESIRAIVPGLVKGIFNESNADAYWVKKKHPWVVKSIAEKVLEVMYREWTVKAAA